MSVTQPWKKLLGVDVLTAARARIAEVFDAFPRIYLSGPSGKDSGVMMHLVCEEARRRGRKVGVLYVDLEAQYKATIENVRALFTMHADVIEPHWVALPLHLRNAVSAFQPYWICWDPTCPEAWVRPPPREAITDPTRFPFYREPWEDSAYALGRNAMEFEDFIEAFGHWYAQGQACACFVGIRAAESLNRWRAISGDHARWRERKWTTWKGATLFNAYPIYDWKTEDIWTFYGKTGLPYPRTYDLMHKAGVPISLQRICQPYGDDQRRGLWLYSILEPETWARVAARVTGANHGALYAGVNGNVLGVGKVTCPPGHTWESYARFLLASMPSTEAEHYRTKINAFLMWYSPRGYSDGIPDEADPRAEASRKAPSWRRICKVILKNDRLCKGLGFGQTKPEHYERYIKVQKKREALWRAANAVTSRS